MSPPHRPHTMPNLYRHHFGESTRQPYGRYELHLQMRKLSHRATGPGSQGSAMGPRPCSAWPRPSSQPPGPCAPWPTSTWTRGVMMLRIPWNPRAHPADLSNKLRGFHGPPRGQRAGSRAARGAAPWVVDTGAPSPLLPPLGLLLGSGSKRGNTEQLGRFPQADPAPRLCPVDVDMGEETARGLRPPCHQQTGLARGPRAPASAQNRPSPGRRPEPRPGPRRLCLGAD